MNGNNIKSQNYMKQQKIKTITMPMCIQVQDGIVKTSDCKKVDVICESNRLIIDISCLQEIHPLEVDTILNEFTKGIGNSVIFDYLVIKGETRLNVAETFGKTAGTRLFDPKYIKSLIDSMTSSYPKTLNPLLCTYSMNPLPSPYQESDQVAVFTFYRND